MPSDDIPSLADLRRPRSSRRRALAPEPTLFDLTFPPPRAVAPAAPLLSTFATAPPPLLQTPMPAHEPTEATAPALPDPQVWTVAALLNRLRGMVERSYGHVSVEGEISNWRPAGSGHCYFTLKDGAAQLSVVMFRRQASLLRFTPSDGDAVRVRGQLSVFETRGQLQLIAESMEAQGLGALLAAVRELKERLRREGVFATKRPLPDFPRCIGIVTSEQGAALRDIVKVCRRRHAAVNLLVYPAAVQGPNCAREVAAGVRWFSLQRDRNTPHQVDVILVARGGGSFEDLHGFDDEFLARTIAASSVPVISGVGHATDSTLADAAADVCAPTPSAAAELVTAAQHRVEERVLALNQRLLRAGSFELLRARQRLSHLSADLVLGRTLDAVERRAQQLDDLAFRAESVLTQVTRTRAAQVAQCDARLSTHHVAERLRVYRDQLDKLHSRLQSTPSPFLAAPTGRVERASNRLDMLDPLRVLQRGYALVYGPGGTLLRHANEISPGETLVARLSSGHVRATATEVTDTEPATI